jgi:hypothetical protein
MSSFLIFAYFVLSSSKHRKRDLQSLREQMFAGGEDRVPSLFAEVFASHRESFHSSVEKEVPDYDYLDTRLPDGSFTLRDVAVGFGKLHTFALDTAVAVDFRSTAFVYNQHEQCRFHLRATLHSQATTLGRCTSLSERLAFVGENDFRDSMRLNEVLISLYHTLRVTGALESKDKYLLWFCSADKSGESAYDALAVDILNELFGDSIVESQSFESIVLTNSTFCFRRLRYGTGPAAFSAVSEHAALFALYREHWYKRYRIHWNYVHRAKARAYESAQTKARLGAKFNASGDLRVSVFDESAKLLPALLRPHAVPKTPLRIAEKPFALPGVDAETPLNPSRQSLCFGTYCPT